MEEKYIPIIRYGESGKSKLSDILIVKREKRKIWVIDEENEYDFYGRIEKVFSQLDNRFYEYCENEFVNLERISLVKDHIIQFKNGYNFIIENESYVKVKQKHVQYLMGENNSE